jgi:hypothetical protein
MPNQSWSPSAGSTVEVRMRGLLTPAQCSGMRGDSSSQVAPPSVLRHT